MRATPTLYKVRHLGLRAYHHARRIATHLNDAVETGVDVYGNLIRPLLHHQGIDTSDADHALLKSYAKYDRGRTAVNGIDRVLQR